MITALFAKRVGAAALAAGLVFGGAACSDEDDPDTPTTEEDGLVDGEGADLDDSAEDVGNEIEEGAEDVGEEIEEGADEVGNTLDGDG